MSQPDLSYIAEPLRRLAVPVSELTLDPRNARKHGAKNLTAIRESLERFGFLEPLVVQKQGMIVRAGNGRLQVAKILGWSHVPAVVVDQEDAEAAAFAIADNKTSSLAEWDEANLVAVLSDLRVHNLDLLSATGFDPSEVDALLQATAEASLPREPPRGAAAGAATTYEVDVDAYELAHTCPRCGFSFNDGDG